MRWPSGVIWPAVTLVCMVIVLAGVTDDLMRPAVIFVASLGVVLGQVGWHGPNVSTLVVAVSWLPWRDDC
jgi:hypothetical protein